MTRLFSSKFNGTNVVSCLFRKLLVYVANLCKYACKITFGQSQQRRSKIESLSKCICNHSL